MDIVHFNKYAPNGMPYRDATICDLFKSGPCKDIVLSTDSRRVTCLNCVRMLSLIDRLVEKT